MEGPEETNAERKQTGGCQGLGGEGETEDWRGVAKEGGVSFWGDESILKSIVMMVIQLCEHTLVYTTERRSLNTWTERYASYSSIKLLKSDSQTSFIRNVPTVYNADFVAGGPSTEQGNSVLVLLELILSWT